MAFFVILNQLAQDAIIPINVTQDDIFVELIYKEILGRTELELIKNNARFLLNEPESFQHIFHILKNMGKKQFHTLKDHKKILLFHLPLETYQHAIQKNIVSLTDYLRASDDSRKQINTDFNSEISLSEVATSRVVTAMIAWGFYQGRKQQTQEKSKY